MEYRTQSQTFDNCIDAIRFMQLQKRAIINPNREASYSELKALADDFLVLSWQFIKYPTKNYENYPKLSASYAKMVLSEIVSKTTMTEKDKNDFIELYISNFNVRSVIKL